MKGVYTDMDSHWNGNVLHLSIKNLEEFNRLLEKVREAHTTLDKALHELSCFNLKIVFDDSKPSE